MAVHEVSKGCRGQVHCSALIALFFSLLPGHLPLSIISFGQPQILLFIIYPSPLQEPVSSSINQLLISQNEFLPPWFSNKTQLLTLLYSVVKYSSVLLSAWKLLEHRELVLYIFGEDNSFLVFICFIWFGLVYFER